MKRKGLLKTLLLLCALVVGGGSVWADPIQILSWDGTDTEVSFTSGYTYVKSEKGDKKSGYFQDSGTAGSSVISFSLYHTTNKLFSTTPSTVTFTANLGGGSAKDPLDNNVYVCFLDKDGTEISGSATVVTTKILGKDASPFSVEMSTEKAANAYGVKLYHTKESSYNVRYYSFSLNYEEASTKTATTTTITSTGITNTDLKNGTAAGSLSASVTAGGSPVAGATVTWSSGDTDVATIDEYGVVTLVGVGKTTITASYAGDGTYNASSKTYELTVINSLLQNTTITIDDWSSLFGVAADAGALSGDALKDYEGTKENVTIDYLKGSSSNMYIKTSDLRIYNGNSLSFTAPDGFAITQIDFEGNTSEAKAPTADVGTFSYSDKKWTGFASKVTLSRNSGKDYTKFTKATITLASEESIVVTDAGFATYVSDADLDYSESGLKAYRATVSGTAITFTKVTTAVPAGEGVLLQAAAGSYDVPVVTGVAAWAAADNAFVRGEDAAVYTDNGDGKYNYILNNVGGVVGFYKANGQTVATNRAYLQSSTSAARIAIDLEDEVSGISTMYNEESTTNGIYDLQGRRVAQPTKGLYIMNGKKVIFK